MADRYNFGLLANKRLRPGLLQAHRAAAPIQTVELFASDGSNPSSSWGRVVPRPRVFLVLRFGSPHAMPLRVLSRSHKSSNRFRIAHNTLQMFYARTNRHPSWPSVSSVMLVRISLVVKRTNRCWLYMGLSTFTPFALAFGID